MSDQGRSSTKRIASAGALIRELLSRRGMEGKLREYRAWQVWDEVVGPQIAARATPIRIREGVLEVRVDHPVWMQQLQLMKPKILERLNGRLGEAVIRDLFLRRGKVAPRQAAPAAPSPPAWRSVSLSEKERSDIESTLAPLPDPELRARLRDLIIRQTKLEKAREKKGEAAEKGNGV